MTVILNTLYSFMGSDGAIPIGGLIADANGNLFGVTEVGGLNGGATGDGTVFELVKSANGYTFSSLLSFPGAGGSTPYGGLLADANGNLFGTTALGGDASSDGTVFELVKNGASYIFLPPLAFNGANGSNPSGGLITDSNGDFFGVANAGGANGDGTVFEFAKTGASYTLKALASFTGANGTGPEGNLIADANGDLFGATVSGGAGNKGTVFELVKSGATYTLNDIAAFNGANGDTPLGSLIADANGDLFGATLMGGTSNKGTVFELVKTASGYTLVTLVSFTGGADGGNPQGGLIIDANGDLFGVTGGGNNQGTVFELANGASGYKLSTLLSFTGGADGGFPLGSLLADANGDLFGATAGGGGSNNGTVFEIVNSPFLSSAIKVVHNLNSSQDLLVYELYQAAYARIPDNGGFLYWAGVADSQHTSALALADAFLSAPEFTQKYGANPSNTAFVTELYTNVLGRAPDTGGLNYWIGQANAGQPHDLLLVDFATSAENVNLIANHVANGFWTT